MKIYSGKRWHNRYPETSDSLSVTVRDDELLGSPVEQLRPYFPNKPRHYDMPLDWGAGQLGFGGTNLSASILADHFESWTPEGLEPIPSEIIKAFLELVVSKFSYETWEIDSEEIHDFVAEYAEAQIEMVERFESEHDEANLSSELIIERLYPRSLNDYVPEWDELRGVDN